MTTRFTLVLIACAFVLTAAAVPAAAQGTPCNEEVRQQFADDVAAGATETYLEATYGHCRQNYESPTCSGTSTTTGMAFAAEPYKTNTNNGSIWYERMNGCGYHPQAETLACDVEIRRPWGYGGFPGGTDEHILFCMDCNRDGLWDYATLGSVHVTDDTSGTAPSWYFNASASTWAAPPICTANDGQVTDVRAVLSWVLRPNPVGLTDCNQFNPFWGNTIDFSARRDP